MPMDGLMLRFVVRELNEKLEGARVDRVLQPERDEIHLLLRAGGQNRRLLLSASAGTARAHLSERPRTGPQEPPMFCMLLRKHLAGGRLKEIRQIAGDRILSLCFATRNELGDATERTIVAEMMGRHSNIILVDADGRIVDAARHVSEDLSRVRQIQPGLLYKLPPAQDKLDPDAATEEALRDRLALEHGSLEKAVLHTLSGFSPQAAHEACVRLGMRPDDDRDSLDPAALSSALLRYCRGLFSLNPPVLILGGDGMPLDVFPFPQRHLDGLPVRAYGSPSEALEAFYDERDRREHMKQRAAGLQRIIRSSLERTEKKIAIQDEALAGAARMEEYRRSGELIQASAHLLQKGASEAFVSDYYEPDCPEVRIPMDASLTPMQNAQRYFKLYRKARGASQLAAEQKEKAERERAVLEQMEDDLRKAASERDLSELRALLEDAGFARRTAVKKARKEPPSQPMLYRSSDGTAVEVGKNAAQNERLTLSARGEEYWLHAQRMPGSHVIVHSASPSERTLSEAAQLAAWYSKGNASANVPVDVTQRRYVKKPGGTPPGFVTYTHQRTVYVTPDEALIRTLRQERE